MSTVTIGPTAAGTNAVDYLGYHDLLNAATGPAGARREVHTLPGWLRHGTQPSYWTETWLRKERLADWDRVAGTIYDTDDIEDVIRQLNADD